MLMDGEWLERMREDPNREVADGQARARRQPDHFRRPRALKSSKSGLTKGAHVRKKSFSSLEIWIDLNGLCDYSTVDC